MLKIILIALIQFIFAPKLLSQHDVIETQSWGKKYDRKRNLYIQSYDGTSLVAQVLLPKAKYFPSLRPAVIFANSWTLDENEYEMQARRFASRGYIVLSYATRGFGRSEGMVSAAGPDDVRDVSAMIDWLEEHTAVDVDRIAMSGVSYGGGISLLALAQEPRLFTAAALSSWSDLEQSLYGNATLRRVWIDILLKSGEIAGRIDPEFKEIYESLKNNENIDEIRAWANERSARFLVDKINQKGAPVLLANSYRDNLFPPSQSLPFFEALTVEKKFYMNRGIHASAETSGIIGLRSEIWDSVHDWFDHWLTDKKSILKEDYPYILQSEEGLEYFKSLPKGNAKKGGIALNVWNDIEKGGADIEKSGIDIDTLRDSGASTGVPIIGAIFDSHTPIKTRKRLSRVNKKHGAVYVGEKLASEKKIRGIPKVMVDLIPNSPELRLVAYLYDLDRWGKGTLISHGVVSLRGLIEGEEISINLDLALNSYDIEKGHRFALVIDGGDQLYGKSSAQSEGFRIVHDGSQKLALLIP